MSTDLAFFKKSRKLDTSFEKTFVHDLLKEFDTSIIDGTMMYDRLDSDSIINDNEEMNIADNILLPDLYFNDNDNDNISVSQLSEESQNRFEGTNSNLADNILTLQTDLLNNNNNFDNNDKLSTTVSNSFMDGFSYLKTANIQEYISQFGDGNKQVLNNMPHFRNFTSMFDKLDNLKFCNLNNKNAQNKKVKKQEKLFDFSKESEISKVDIFEKESKNKNKVLKESRKDLKRKRIKTLYNYDRSM